MNADIAFAKPVRARSAVRTAGDGYTLLGLRGGELKEGERLSGEFRLARCARYRTERPGKSTVYATDCRCSRTDAARWVYGI